jgi:glycosyltransferase involved in cell wall biosynthesis
VVNEALAFGLPILASSQIGANDVLTRNLLNGFVVELGSVKGIAHAMLELAGNEERWNDLAANRAAVRGWRTRSALPMRWN